jgi:hypothetical protein
MSPERKTLKVFFSCPAHAYAPAMTSTSPVKMSTPQELVQCVLWLAELQSLTAVQRRFGTPYGRKLPIRFWDNKLRTTCSLLRVKSPGETWISEENVNRIREAFQRSVRK